jgi:hypothetical protein
MKNLLIILFLIPVIGLSQIPDTCFTQEQVLDISFTLDSLYQLSDINDQIISEQKSLIEKQKSLIQLDSLQLNYTTKQVALLRENINMYIEREKLFKPKWYDRPAIWFIGGVVTTSVVIYLTK